MITVKQKTRKETLASYSHIMEIARESGKILPTMAELGRVDDFFRLIYIHKRADANNDWCFARCREVQAEPFGYLDLWSREHYKSSIVTFNKTFGVIINNPEWTNCILSFNRPIAKSFLRQIKLEAETNELLPLLYPDIFWSNPQKEAPKWSEDDGLIFKREGNPKEATIEAWGLIDGQPISKHYTRIIYNDIVVKDNSRSDEMIKKTTEAWELSLNLSTVGGVLSGEGTYYHYADTYHTIIERGALKPRIYPATEDGTPTGKPVLWTPEYLAEKIRNMGPSTAACQLLLNPKQESINNLKKEWLRFWRPANFRNMNRYIICDPANKKKKSSDFTVFMVVGLGQDLNVYIITMVRDRLSLRERGNVLFKLHQDYRPRAVGYEQYGMASDIEHFTERMDRDNYRFPIIGLGGNVAKEDRINLLEPLFFQGRIYLPETCVRTNYEGEQEDLTQIFVDSEYLEFPFSTHDDMLDCLARIEDPALNAIYPKGSQADTFGIITNNYQPMYDPLHRDYESNKRDQIIGEYDPLGRA